MTIEDFAGPGNEHMNHLPVSRHVLKIMTFPNFPFAGIWTYSLEGINLFAGFVMC